MAKVDHLHVVQMSILWVRPRGSMMFVSKGAVKSYIQVDMYETIRVRKTSKVVPIFCSLKIQGRHLQPDFPWCSYRSKPSGTEPCASWQARRARMS